MLPPNREITIPVRYSCVECGLKDVRCDVPARGSESVETWLIKTTHLLCDDHDRRSPNCCPKFLTDILIPIAGADKPGGPPIM